jgi:hypothetical protein
MRPIAMMLLAQPAATATTNTLATRLSIYEAPTPTHEDPTQEWDVRSLRAFLDDEVKNWETVCRQNRGEANFLAGIASSEVYC